MSVGIGARLAVVVDVTEVVLTYVVVVEEDTAGVVVTTTEVVVKTNVVDVAGSVLDVVLVTVPPSAWTTA
jgi:hypothetical protein